MKSILKTVVFTILAAMMSISLYAQPKDVVTGTITSVNGEPLIGASVMVKDNASRGVVADMDGHYSIPASVGETLVYSCLGYDSKEVKLTGSVKIDVVLTEDVNYLDETIVVGYAPMRKSDFTGSISSLKSDELQKSAATLGSSLVGRVAGVEVRQANGAPGAGVNIRVRGVNSLSASTAPLYVVDGYPVADDDFINPNDIESIEILKDAASAAIYGSRGASGVVLITTKRGKDTDKASVTFDYSYGIQNLGRKIDLLNAREFAELYVEARNNSYWAYCMKAGVPYDPRDNNELRSEKTGQTKQNVGLSPFFWDFAKNDYASTAFMYDTDWQDEYFKTAGMSRYNVSVTGGNKNLKYMASLGYLDQDGIIAPSGHKQINARINIDAKVTDRLSVTASYAMTDTKTREVKTYGRSNSGGEGSEGYDGATQGTIVAVPNFPAYIDDKLDLSAAWVDANTNSANTAELWRTYNTPGNLARSWMNFFSSNWGINSSENPLVIANELLINNTKVRHNLTFSANYEILKGLNIKAQVGRLWYDQTYTKFRPNTIGAGGTIAQNPALETSSHYAVSTSSKDEDTLGELIATYKKSFGEHRIDALAGVTAQSHTYTGIGIMAKEFSDNRIPDVSATVNPKAVEEYSVDRYKYTLLSYLARFNYSYSDRYAVTASFRGDGSSRFGKESKWGYFPSISAGWSLSKEPFLKDAMPRTDIRLRASWGMSGNNNIGNYSSIAAIGTGTVPFGSSIFPTAYESSFVDAGLSWETTKQTNIGLDLGFWNGRLNVIANYYNSITTDVLYSLGIPSISGSTSTTTNLGDSKIRNRGFDIQLDARILEGPVTWTVGTNFSLNRNKVLYLAEGVDEIFNNTMRSSPTHTTKVGYPIGSFLGYRTNGIMSTADYQNVLKDREVYVANGNAFPAGYKLQGPAVPDYSLEYLSPGNVIYNDFNGDGKITEDDREILGSAYPDFTGGFNTSVSFYGFDVALGFTYSVGAQVVNFNDYYCYNMEGSGNQYGVVRERWKSDEEPGNGSVPRAFRHGNKNTGMKVSDRYIDDADFLRLSTASIGYTFPKSVCEKIKAQGLRVYVNGDNLFTLTNYRGFNPEVDQYSVGGKTSAEKKSNANMTPGFDWGSYPIARIVTFGVKLTF